MHILLSEIAKVGGTEIQELLNAVLRRYAELFPDWEISMISIEKQADRNQQLDSIIKVLQRMKSLPK